VQPDRTLDTHRTHDPRRYIIPGPDGSALPGVHAAPRKARIPVVRSRQSPRPHANPIAAKRAMARRRCAATARSSTRHPTPGTAEDAAPTSPVDGIVTEVDAPKLDTVESFTL